MMEPCKGPVTAEQEKLLEEFDEIGVSARRVRSVTGMSDVELGLAMKDARFPLPVMEMNGMKYWRFGDIARLELGWA